MTFCFTVVRRHLLRLSIFVGAELTLEMDMIGTLSEKYMIKNK